MTLTVLHLFSGSGGLAKGFTDAGFTGVGIDLDPRACDDFRRLTGEAAIVADIGAMGPADLRALVPTCPDVVATSSPCIPAGGDHRDLPAEVLLYPCGSDELEAATGIRWGDCAGRHAGKLGVLDWERPAKTVIGKARVCNTWNAVADPRVDWPADVHAGRPDCYGVADDRMPSGVVRGTALVQSCKASVADPRLHCGQRADAYGVQAATDPRVNVELQHHAHRGTMGVMAADGPAATVRGHHTIRQAPGAVDDPRVEARRYNVKGWPAATHYLVDLDGRPVLYGPRVDFADPRPRGDLVIVARDGVLHRPFTDAELALLQGFPVGFVFCGPSSCARKSGATGRRKRIGNAVPPPTAYAIAVECRATLEASAVGGFRLATGDVWVAPAQEEATA